MFQNKFIYKVPLYQRHYVWDSINWEHLWDDIKENSDVRFKNSKKITQTVPIEGTTEQSDVDVLPENGGHFTGAIVIQEIESDAVYEIIDGQQRLTTFQIILCAIRDLCNDLCNEFEEFEDKWGILPKIYQKIYMQPGNTTSGIQNYDVQHKLVLREGTDLEVFLSLLQEESKQIQNNCLIWEAYRYFKGEIKNYIANDYSKLYYLYESISEDFKVAKIQVKPDDEYAKIFKSINGTGKRLAQFDLLRNDLFLRAVVGERDELYEKYWSHFEEDPNWEPKVLDNLLKNFLKIKLEEDFNDQLTLFDLYDKLYYKKKLVKELNLSETDPGLVKYEFYDLNRYSNVYHDIHIADSGNIGRRIKFYDEFKDKFDVLDQLKLFILYITSEFGLSSRKLNRIFNLFEAYVVRGMLHIGSKGYNSPPLGKLNNLFLRALDRKESLSIVALVYLLSTEFVTDPEVKPVFNTGKGQRLPETEKKRKHSSSNLMREFGGRYIFSVLGWSIDKDELFEKFCEKWPSAEVMLQQELIGDLPIVYSKMPVSVETIGHLGFDSENHTFAQVMPRLENYVFVTYQGMIELSEYEIDENSIMGVEVNSTVENILDLKEILFAFPMPAVSGMQNHINRIRDDVRNLMLEPVSKQDAFPTTDWLFEEISELQTRVENSNYEHWFLSNTEAIVVSRAGHELQGKLKSFNNNAIYMEINEDIVTVYMHGIYEIKRKAHSKKRKKGRRGGSA